MSELFPDRQSLLQRHPLRTFATVTSVVADEHGCYFGLALDKKSVGTITFDYKTIQTCRGFHIGPLYLPPLQTDPTPGMVLFGVCTYQNDQWRFDTCTEASTLFRLVSTITLSGALLRQNQEQFGTPERQNIYWVIACIFHGFYDVLLQYCDEDVTIVEKAIQLAFFTRSPVPATRLINYLTTRQKTIKNWTLLRPQLEVMVNKKPTLITYGVLAHFIEEHIRAPVAAERARLRQTNSTPTQPALEL